MLAFLLIPNFIMLSINAEHNDFLLSIFCLLTFLAIIKTTKHIYILFPFFLLLPIIISYQVIYESYFNEQILSIILETNYHELKEFLGSNLYLYLIFYVFWLLFIVFLFYKNYQMPKVWSHRSRYWVISIGVIYLIGMFSLNQLTSNEINSNFSNNHDNFLVDEKNQFTEQMKKVYPFGLIPILNDFYREQKKIDQAFLKNKDFLFNVKYYPKDHQQIVILVIGETARKANWSLYGYERNTNPYLSQQSNLVLLEDMLSISNATRSSIPIILSRKPAEKVFNYNFSEKSIISAFKEAGFKTYWLSTQQKFGAFDTSTSVYAKEADEVIFLNKTNYANKGDTDEIIIPKLEQILKQKNDIFIVIHTLGSHFDYSYRHTDIFNIFKPSLHDIENYSMQEKRFKTYLINSYDNSILYTDYVLKEILKKLESKSEASSFLIYTSDHGEDLFDGECNKSGHGNHTIYNYEIPSFIWYSDLYYRNNIDKVNFAKKNKTTKIDHTVIFPTLIDAMDLKIPNYILQKSLLGELSPYSRIIMGGLDYDKAEINGICKEIK